MWICNIPLKEGGKHVKEREEERNRAAADGSKWSEGRGENSMIRRVELEQRSSAGDQRQSLAGE